MASEHPPGAATSFACRALVAGGAREASGQANSDVPAVLAATGPYVGAVEYATALALLIPSTRTWAAIAAMLVGGAWATTSAAISISGLQVQSCGCLGPSVRLDLLDHTRSPSTTSIQGAPVVPG